MVKPELGTKRTCVACGARFYDLGKSPAVCPKCATEQPVEQPRVRRPVGNVVEDKTPKKPVPAEADPDVDAPDEDVDEDVLDDDDADLDEDDTLDEDLDVPPPGEEEH